MNNDDVTKYIHAGFREYRDVVTITGLYIVELQGLLCRYTYINQGKIEEEYYLISNIAK